MPLKHTDSVVPNQFLSPVHEVKFQEHEEEPFLDKRPISVFSRCSLEYMFCACSLICILSYGFVSISAASRENAAELRVGPPRWQWLSKAPFYSVGYNSEGDGQWEHLDSYLWLMMLVFVLFAIGSRVIRWAFNGARAVSVIQFYHIAMGVLYSAFIHGPSFCLPISFVLLNYIFMLLCVKFKAPYRVFMTLMWVSQLGLLFFVGYYGKYLGFEGNVYFSFASWWTKRVSWTVTFNMAILRMIAFNNDMYEGMRDNQTQRDSLERRHKMTCIECAQMREANCDASPLSTRCYKLRTESPCRPDDYNVMSYMAYMLYLPLYIAGPMSSFNAFVSHLYHPTVVMSPKQMVFYGLRIAGIYFTLMFMLHFAYLNAFRLHPNIFLALPISQKAYICYYSLAFLWLKFSVVWKLSRLAAIIDGFDVPEDMRRCFSNAVSVSDFWRDWHASFNLWVVRYLYIPMGGSKKKHLNIFPIFFFIAVWHDIALHLIKWAACIVFVFILELAVSSLWSSPRFAYLRCSRFALQLRHLGGLFTVFGLIVANLIGFSSQANTGDGHETDGAILEGLSSAGPDFYIFTFLMLYSLAALGTATRDAEKEERNRLKKLYGIK